MDAVIADVALVKSAVFPSGRIVGQAWRSALSPGQSVRRWASPPAADTRMRPRASGAKTIVSFGPQAPPSGLGASATVMAGPPVSETFFSFPALKNATHCPSGEKNGWLAFSVPGIANASNWSRWRR